MGSYVPDWHEFVDLLCRVGKDLPGPVGTAVVHHHDLMRYALYREFEMQMLHRGGNAASFITGRNDDGEQP